MKGMLRVIGEIVGVLLLWCIVYALAGGAGMLMWILLLMVSDWLTRVFFGFPTGA